MLYSTTSLGCILPANIDLSIAEFQLINAPARERRITKIINEVRDDYDFVLIDSQPSLGLLTMNAMAAADRVIIPVSCEYLSVRGTIALLRLIGRVKGQLNSSLEVAGLLPTMFDSRTRHAEILQTLRGVSQAASLPPCGNLQHSLCRSSSSKSTNL